MVEYQPTVARSGERAAAIDAGLRAYMNKVYMLMATAMVVTGAVAFYVGSNADLLKTFFTGPIRWAVMFAPLVFVFAFAATIHRVSTATANILFYSFAAVMGLSIAWIFAVFTGVSIAQTFFATAAAFLGLSLYGYTTKTNLSGLGSFLFMGVVGILVVSLLNIFIFQSPILQTAIAILGVLIFAGLTAYDTQQIKQEYLEMAQAGPEGQAYLEKGAIMGALRLYLDFVNMFMFLLQLFGAQQE